jgi:hypothetical protein
VGAGESRRFAGVGKESGGRSKGGEEGVYHGCGRVSPDLCGRGHNSGALIRPYHGGVVGGCGGDFCGGRGESCWSLEEEDE